MLEDLLLKARIGGVGAAVGSHHSVGRSPFASVAGSSWGDSVASRTNYWLPTVTEVDVGNVAAVDVSLGEPCCSRQADARLAAGHGSGEEPGSDSLKRLQEIKRNEKKRQSKCGNGQEKVGRTRYCPLVMIKEVTCSLKKC